MAENPERRGDRIAIVGDYQYRAVTQGPAVQRFWHQSKILAIERHLPPLSGDRVLDLGCGSGVVAGHLAAAGAHVTAIDGNAEAIRFASAQFRLPNLEFRAGLIEDLALPGETFDKAYCLEVIEHLYLPQVRGLLASVRALLRPGGCLLLTTPNYRSPWPLIEKGLDLTRLVPRLQDDQHVTRFHPRRLRQTWQDAGFERVVETTFCTVAPWLSLLGWSLALAADRIEARLRLPFGCLLLHVVRRPA